MIYRHIYKLNLILSRACVGGLMAMTSAFHALRFHGLVGLLAKTADYPGSKKPFLLSQIKTGTKVPADASKMQGRDPVNFERNFNKVPADAYLLCQEKKQYSCSARTLTTR